MHIIILFLQFIFQEQKKKCNHFVKYLDYLEIKDFEVKFSNFPENASNIYVEIID